MKDLIWDLRTLDYVFQKDKEPFNIKLPFCNLDQEFKIDYSLND